MQVKLICTSYDKLKDGSLQLRNNWIEEANNEKLQECIKRWNLGEDFKYPCHNSISEILCGVMESGYSIHVRILRFS